ncbi:MAG: LysM domain-containing protein [Planctomycetota bacterium]
MKKNERFLVYAVTSFLAVILVVAVLFTRGGDKGAGSAAKLQDLGELMKAPGAAKDSGAPKDGVKLAGAAGTGLPTPTEVAGQTPLVAGASKALVAADLVAQQLGPSRRDRTVRFVRARNGDTLDQLVRRWCGARDPFLAETKSLNEDLVVLKVGNEVAVPWVEDEVLLAAIEASKPKTLVPHDPVAAGEGPGAGAPNAGNAAKDAANGGTSPSFAMPGANGKTAIDAVAGRTSPATTGGTSYTVKGGDSLWRIAERTYGRKNADRMVGEIKAANPGLTDRVREGQKIVLPPAPPAGA